MSKRGRRRRLVVGAALVFACAAGMNTLGALPAHAQIFSPGDLAVQHKQLEGLNNCLKCHEPGQKLSNARCLKCHVHVAKRVKQRRGYHGKMKGNPSCASCHSDHKGRGHQLVQWPGGKKSLFRHGQTGWPLKGAHGKLDCKKCHERRRITDRAVKKLQKKRKRTMLGLPHPGSDGSCKACHFDEHRGQLPTTCSKCHVETAFKPAKGFKHNRDADFSLTGKHRRVRCKKCHDVRTDTKTSQGAFPPPVSQKFAHYKPVSHRGCLSCHEDHHDGQMGTRCTRCHTTAGWDKLDSKMADTGFHDKTEFPLRGGHVGVACDDCHGPFPGVKGRSKEPLYKPIDHGRCDDCHTDSHVGQLEGVNPVPRPGQPSEARDCNTCHSEERFAPSLFTLEKHGEVRYPLEGSHQAVACNRCHPKERSLAKNLGSEQKRWLKARGREPLLSLFKMARPDVDGSCETCHADVHGGQLAGGTTGDGDGSTGDGKRCQACHQVSSFFELNFDHNKDSRFALEGKHQGADCRGCHQPDPSLEKEAVRYKPLEQECASCHADVHFGQLKAEQEDKTDCARCHAATGFTPVKGFDHQKTAFPLQGRHARIECKRCHKVVDVTTSSGSVQSAAWYKGLPLDCKGCHQDEHKGRFDSYALSAQRSAPSESDASSASSGSENTCASCHAETGWLPASFAHERTGFELKGSHGQANCRSCHAAGYDRAPAVSCSSCHMDPHGQELGMMCQGCHDERSWASKFDVVAHRSTNFPLSGRHAFLPCEECHRGRRDQGFSRKAVDCATCHRSQFELTGSTSIDHLGSRFSDDCKSCHQPTSFRPARFLLHESCFPLLTGPHTSVRCQDCHFPVAGTVANGACRTQNTGCINCHAHTCDSMAAVHEEVSAYGCVSERCVGCHTR